MANSFAFNEEFQPLTSEQLEQANLETLKQQYSTFFLMALKLGSHGSSLVAELRTLKNDVENKVVTAEEGLISFQDIAKRIIVTRGEFFSNIDWFQNDLTFDVETIADAVDDVAASEAGVAIGQVYRDGSILKIRIN